MGEGDNTYGGVVIYVISRSKDKWERGGKDTHIGFYLKRNIYIEEIILITKTIIKSVWFKMKLMGYSK